MSSTSRVPSVSSAVTGLIRSRVRRRGTAPPPRRPRALAETTALSGPTVTSGPQVSGRRAAARSIAARSIAARSIAARLLTTTVIAGLLAGLAVPGAAVAAPARPAGDQVVDGMTLHYLPAPLGRASDFTYDYDDVDFVSRVWETHSGADPDIGWRVDLDVDVMRGARLTSGAALHDWFLDYEQRDPAPSYTPITIHGGPGWICDDQVFWLVRPGVAVSVQLDGSRWSGQSVLRTAAGADTSGL